jgi:hypothetical protein
MPPPPAGLRGQLVEHPPIETVTFDLGTTPPPTQYRLYTSLPGPAVGSPFSGSIVIGFAFQVTQPGLSLVGYSPWCPNSGMPTTPVNFALWQLTGTNVGVLVPAATMTGGTLTQGAYTDAFLPAPVPLTGGQGYFAQYGFTNGFVEYDHFWDSTGVGYDGLRNGPLEAFSDQGASNPAPSSMHVCAFETGSADPTAGLVLLGNLSFNAFLDVLVSTG